MPNGATSSEELPSEAAQRFGWRSLVGFGLYLMLVPVLLLASAGRLDWWMAWVWSAVSLAFNVGSRVLVARRHPDLLVERARYREVEGVAEWDRKLSMILGVLGPVAILVVAGLDERFGWSPALPLGLALGALVVMVASLAFATWAMLENRFFSAVVRIQTERGHTVCSTGPYRLVRHPGYAGGLLVWPCETRGRGKYCGVTVLVSTSRQDWPPTSIRAIQGMKRGGGQAICAMPWVQRSAPNHVPPTSPSGGMETRSGNSYRVPGSSRNGNGRKDAKSR